MRLTWGLRSRPRSRPVCSEAVSPQVQPIFEAASLLLPADEHDGKPFPAMFRRAGIRRGARSSSLIGPLKLFLARCSPFSDEDLISQLFAMVLNGSYADPANNGDLCRRVKAIITMHDTHLTITALILLLLIASGVAMITKWVPVPYTVALVVVGLVTSQLHFLPTIHISSSFAETVFAEREASR